MTEIAVFNPFEPGYLDDPYPQFDAVLETNPVHTTLLGGYALARYADCFRLLRDPELSVDQENATPSEGGLPDVMEEIARERGVEVVERKTLLDTDPPDHTRLRKLVSRVFTPRAIEALRPRVQALVAEALDAADPSEPWDLVANLAFPLPFQVIHEMLGMPDDGMRDEVRHWTHLMATSLDPILDPEVGRQIVDAATNFREYLAGVIEWKRANPTDDLLSALIQAEEGGDMLSDEELRSQTTLLYIAGHETTVSLIGNGTLALANHPDQRQRLVDDPDLVPNAIDELLRFDPPVQMTRRITRLDWKLDDDLTIPQGTFVLAMTAAANRDVAQWGETARTLDVGREGAGKHLAFGSGVHHCLGAALARLEGQEAIGGLVRRFPDFSLAASPVRNGRIILRGLDGLSLHLG